MGFGCNSENSLLLSWSPRTLKWIGLDMKHITRILDSHFGTTCYFLNIVKIVCFSDIVFVSTIKICKGNKHQTAFSWQINRVTDRYFHKWPGHNKYWFVCWLIWWCLKWLTQCPKTLSPGLHLWVDNIWMVAPGIDQRNMNEVATEIMRVKSSLNTQHISVYVCVFHWIWPPCSCSSIPDVCVCFVCVNVYVCDCVYICMCVSVWSNHLQNLMK